MPQTEYSLLLRVRGRTQDDKPDVLNLEVEAQLNDRSIFLAGKTQVDLAQLRSAESAENNAYGRLLGHALHECEPVRAALRAVNESETMRVQLMVEAIDGCKDAIRWERTELFVDDGPVGISPFTPFSHFAAVNRPMERPPVDEVFRLLFVLTSPTGMPDIDTTGICEAVLHACADPLNSGLLQITILAGHKALDPQTQKRCEAMRGVTLLARASTFEDAATLLNPEDPLKRFHGLHLVAHGTHTDHFYLLLEDAKGALLASPDDEIISKWKPGELRLVFLESCQSAAGDEGDPRAHIASFMSQLSNAGVAGVVAMQDSIIMADACRFMGGFYGRLLQDGKVDEAANYARAIINQDAGYNWSIPAVMTRLKDGAVWRESPLRFALRTLRKSIQDSQNRDLYPAFPLDVISLTKEELAARMPEGSGQVSTATLNDGVRIDASVALNEAIGDRRKQNVCLLGPRGSAKRTMLESAFISQFDDYLDSAAPVPVIFKLADCLHGFEAEDEIVARAICKHLASQSAVPLDDLREKFQREPFLFIILGDDDLGEADAQRGLVLIKEFQNKFATRAHQFIIALDENSCRVEDLPNESICLLIQPMSMERVQGYLNSAFEESDKANQIVLMVMRENGLFDLAESPWLLNEMLDQAERGVLKRTRAGILERIANDGVAKFQGSAGMRNRVEAVLCRLAWELQNSRTPSLSGSTVFDILGELRGNRDYSLVAFRSQLVDQCKIMATCGEEGLRFAYPGFQAYFCARYIISQPDVERLLTDITATLGRRARVQWWAETLYDLAGLCRNTQVLLAMILSGSPLYEGDQLNIAARCLQEARFSFGGLTSDDPTIRSIVSGLIYRSHPASGRCTASRSEALKFLGPLKEKGAIPHLSALVLNRVRSTATGLKFDFSGVRLAAIKAILYVQDEALSYVRNVPEWKADASLQKTLADWTAFDAAEVIKDVQQMPSLSASVAAFALCLLKPKDALSALEQRLFADTCDDDLMWALTDAMLELGDDSLTAVASECLKRENRLLPASYLIGKLGGSRATEEQRQFLRTWANAPLLQGKERLKGRALLALAELNDTSILAQCHDLLENGQDPLRYFAVQALRFVGNADTLQKLETFCNSTALVPGGEFTRHVGLEVYQALYWKLSGGQSREVMIPVTTQPKAAQQAAG